MAGKCLCEASETLIFPCSGASNWGQISNEVALRLREAKEGTPYCTAGIGGHVKPLVETTRKAKVIVALDGCPMGCVKKCLEGEGFKPAVYAVVSEELGAEVPKAYERPKEEHVKKIYEKILPKVESARKK